MAYPGAVPASVGRRVLASVIDAMAALLLGGAFLTAGLWQWVGASADDTPPAGAVVLTLVGVGLLLALGLVQWWYHGRRGATLGKALVGLRTVDADTGRPIGMGRALLRALVVAAGGLAFAVGQLVVLASPLFDSGGRRQGWHDKAARALVVDVVAGVDPARARAHEAAATARLDGLLAPVAAVDLAHLPPPSGAGVLAPPPPGAPASAPFPPAPPPPPPSPAPAEDPWAELAPTAPDFLAPYPAAVPPPPEPGDLPSRAPRALDTGTGRGAHDGGDHGDDHGDDRGAHRGAHRAGHRAGDTVDGDTDGRSSGGLDDTGIISAVPGLRPVAHGGTPPLEPTVLVDHVPADLAVPAGPAPTPGRAVPTDDGDLDDVEATRLSLSGAGRGRRRTDDPARAVLHLWDGQQVTLTSFALLGRNPARREDEPMPERIITVPDERRSVSKTHLAVGVDPTGVWVRDRGSTNGTVITLSDSAQVICAPGQLVRVPSGATVSFGDFWFIVA